MKGSLLAFGVLALMQASAQVPGDIPANGLVSWWSLAGDAVDEANAHNGTGYSTYSGPDRNGIADAATVFGFGSYIAVPGNTAFNTGTGMTVAAWVSLLDPSANQKIMGRTNYSFNSGFILGVDGAALNPEVWDASGTPYTFSGGSISTEVWTHLAITWSSNGELIGYINGEEVGSVATAAAGIGANNEPMIIGGSPWSQSPLYFATNGSIDDVGLWNRALSEEEIAEVVASGTASVRGPSATALRILPNPATDRITISDAAATGLRPYAIVNSLGAVVTQGSLSGPVSTIDVSVLAPGAYQLRTDAGSFSRFVKQ
ncbi:MAG TPA: LamG-like jellyroll fold domain-containing protein [Flavobacteriales bacterium]